VPYYMLAHISCNQGGRSEGRRQLDAAGRLEQRAFDQRRLASGGGTSSHDDAGESFVGAWNVATGARLAWLRTEDLGDNHDLTFTLDGSRLIAGGQRRMLAWDTAT